MRAQIQATEGHNNHERERTKNDDHARLPPVRSRHQEGRQHAVKKRAARWTMVFRVKDKSMLDEVNVGDKIHFIAEEPNGQLTVTQLEKQQ